MGEIDFVITWVDGNDSLWRAEKNKYMIATDNQDTMGVMEARFREWDLLRFLFRGIEQFAPWVRKIHFVTWGHLPEWMNVSHPKLHIVNHKDFIPEQYLPTFNSHTIEFNLHRIEGLSEKFVYLNDDTFICKMLSEEDFFANDLPCDYAMMDCLTPEFNHTAIYQLNALSTLNAHFNTEVVKKKKKLWFNKKYGLKGISKNVFLSQYQHFVGFKNGHLPLAYLKSTYEELWNLEGKRLADTCESKFRASDNISIWLIRYWQLVKGQFIPVNPASRGKSFLKYDDEMLESIKYGKYKMICVNDLCNTQEEFDYWQPRIYEAFEKLFPEKSRFEL